MAFTRLLALPAAIGAQLSATFTPWRRSLALVISAAPQQATAMGGLMLVQAFLPVGTLWASREVVDAAARTFGLAGAAAGAAGIDWPLPVWVAVAVGLIVAQQLIAPLFQAVQESAGDRVTAHVNGELIKAANRWRGLARFEDPTFANHLSIARNEAARSGVDLLSTAGGLVQTLFTMGAMTAVLWQLHPFVPLLLILAFVPHALLENDFAQNMSNEFQVHSPDGRRIDTYREAVLGAGPAKDTRLFNLGGFFLGQYDITFGRLMGDLWALRRRLMRRMVPAQVLSGAVMVAAYLYAVRHVLDGGLTPGDLVLFGGALLQVEGALSRAGFDIGFIAAYFTWLPSLFFVLDAEPDLPVPPPERAVPAPRPIRSGLVLEHVSFRYPAGGTDKGQATNDESSGPHADRPYPEGGTGEGRVSEGQTTNGGSATERPAPSSPLLRASSPWVLRDISFAISPGERLALVGRNGAGKTTLVKLLARLYDPTEGRILLDGVDLRDYDLDDLRRQIGVIFQDFVSYQLTAQENVGLGDAAHLDDLACVEGAARKGGAAPLIEGLPQGYATPLGSRFGGVNLSGGQWQKIALSRAFMRQAQLLILDEPTAALDVQAEYDVYLRFAELTEGAMTVLVSHRFSTVRMADRILLLEDGRITEAGSHAELVARGGRYATLYELQAGRYR
ncbi:MAG: ABC transporter ATP-binding protein [Chloroflexota bacterium]